MENEQFERLLTAVITAGVLGGQMGTEARSAGDMYRRVELSLAQAGVITCRQADAAKPHSA